MKAILTLGITIFIIVKILLPLMLKGINPIPISVLAAIVITIITILFIAGINTKSISAIIGTCSGVIIAGIIAYFVGSQVRLTGLSSEEATMLMFIPQRVDFDFRGLLFSGIILGALGAIMDVGMSIASSIEEIHNANKSFTRKELFNSGMNVGRDIMGTMTNTLILAYTGSSIPLLLLFMAYETSMIKVINLDIIATEIVRSLSGSIGLVLTIPLTALVSTFLIKRENSKKEGF
ncbi:YibE/F family protein [Tepidimicrobium xylanilyticum]